MSQQRRRQHQQTEDHGERLSFAQQRQLEAEAMRQRRQANVPLYDIPSVLLDLDAEDSPHVRPYDEAMEAAETARWQGAHASIDELTERLAVFAEEAEAADARLAAVVAAPTPWRVSDRDIWSAVLGEGIGKQEGKGREQDGREEQGDQNESVMRRLLYENGVSDRIAADPAKTVRFLLQRQALAAREGGDETVSLPVDSLNGFSAALERCGRFDEVRRLLTLASRSSVRGCQVVAHKGRIIAARLASLPASSSPDASIATLVMLLNLSHHFEARNVGLGAALCGVGLHAAAAALEPAAMQRFLDIGLARGYYKSRASRPVVNAALLAVCAELRRRRANQKREGATDTRAGSKSLADIFSVVVSFRAAILAAGTTEATCLLFAPLPLRRTYLAVLAELGAVRTLWREVQLCSISSSKTGIISAGTLTMAVFRYAKYTAGEPKGGLVAVGAGVQDGRLLRLLDRQMLRAYDEATETRVRGAGEKAEMGAEGKAAVQRGAVAAPSKQQLQRNVVEAFGRTTAQEAMDSIQALASPI